MIFGVVNFIDYNLLGQNSDMDFNILMQGKMSLQEVGNPPAPSVPVTTDHAGDYRFQVCLQLLIKVGYTI